MTTLNRNYQLLSKSFSPLVKAMKSIEDQCAGKPIHVVPSKSQELTMFLEGTDSPVYIHSQYDPKREAESIINQYRDVEEYEHVLFYGVGLGYHIEEFMKRYPNKKVIMYEPQIPFFYHYLNSRSMENINFKNVENIVLEVSADDVDTYMVKYIEELNGKLLVITLPVYERIYADRTKYFINRVKRIVSHITTELQTNLVYEKLWTLNSSYNFSKVLQTPSVIRDLKSTFSGKPVILVAAGPSLNDEIDNLKRIKASKTAFIFAVGSANKTLLTNGIYPDAVCSYDPIQYNHVVLQEIIESNIMSIPLIFGSSVGKNTLLNYPGPLFHFVTGQDTISYYYLNGEEMLNKKEIIGDQPSIAVVMVDILCKLEVSQLILVGQNLAFRDDRYYSSNINYETRSEYLSKEEKLRFVQVESVDGEAINTFPELDIMRKSIEEVIRNQLNVEVINTTVGGAAIKGTKFVRLDTVMKKSLTKEIVNDTWFEVANGGYDRVFAFNKFKAMEREYDRLGLFLNNIVKIMKKIENAVNSRDIKRINKLFVEFDKAFSEILKNEYYKVYVQPMIRSHFNIFNRSINKLKEIIDPIEKGRNVVDIFGKYLYQCEYIWQGSKDLIKEVHQEIIKLQEKETYCS
ncbi:motility associated factor glycosyltransferase family protein [Paenibacillus ferrarius]|uniref:motility associated factor glycosyltransferase family protein n=1 Tax=Paenibacillus ferrarius TaxID=1469647 RepID=UPI003D2A8193